MKQEKNPRSLFFRSRLEFLLAERGISQRQLAAGTKITPQSISNYMRGVRGLPRAEELYIIARYFGVPMESFLDHEMSKELGITVPAGQSAKSGNPRLKRAISRLEQIIEKLNVQVREMRRLADADDHTSQDRT